MGNLQPRHRFGQGPPIIFPVDQQNQIEMNRQFARPPAPRRRIRFRRRNFPNFPGALRHTIRYTRAQREHAINLMNMGISYRQTARMTSPHCSCSTTFRWRQQHLAMERNRRAWQNFRHQHM